MSEPQRDVRQALVNLWEAGQAWEPNQDVPEFHSGSDSEWRHEFLAQQSVARETAVNATLHVIANYLEQIAEAQAREVQRELDAIGIGGYPVSPHPECDSVSDALYIDTKARLIGALKELFVAAPDAQKAGA